MRLCCTAWLIVLGLGSQQMAVAAPDFVFPHEPEAIRLRLEVLVDNQSPEAIWNAFLDRWFAYFDRDANEQLSAAEVARVLPLPLLNQRLATLDIKQFDSNGDGQGELAEIKAFYRGIGFTPIVGNLQSPPSDSVALSETLFQQLDRDGNGILIKSELQQAAALLNRFDQNEDEILSVTELLSLPKSLVPQTAPQNLAKIFAPDNAVIPQVILNALLNEERPLPTITLSAEPTTLVEAVSAPRTSPLRLRLGRNFCAVILEEGSKQKSFKAVRGFYQAQFRTAFGDKKPVTKQQLSQDPTLRLIAEQFEVIERDGDGKLSIEELNVFLLLIEQGIASQSTATLTSHGASLFEMLDQDHNGQLSLRELLSATQVFTAGQLESGISADAIPIQFQLHLERGTPGVTFGSIPIPRATTRPALRVESDAVKEPRWFELLDKNADKSISPREFPGEQSLFSIIDVNHDGLISVEEANTSSAPGTKE